MGYTVNNNIQHNDYSNKINKLPNKFIRGVFIIAGTFFVGLGIIGIILPLLPTTPFLLLAAVLYAKSSQKFYNWLLNNKWFGKYIKNYREGKGIPYKAKIFFISLLWLTIIFSIVYIINNLFVSIILILIALGVSIHLISIRTMRKNIKD